MKRIFLVLFFITSINAMEDQSTCADINFECNLFTRIINFSFENNKFVVRQITEQKVSINEIINSFSILALACLFENVVLVHWLVKNGANLDLGSIPYRQSPLHIATYSHNIEIIKILLDAGAKKDSIDFWGNMPLYYAKKIKNKEIIKLLEAKSGNPVFCFGQKVSKGEIIAYRARQCYLKLFS